MIPPLLRYIPDMGKRGPSRRPVELAVINGEKPSRINTDAPEAPIGALEPPPDLDPAVLEVWDYTVAQLERMNLDSPADRDVLVAYCEAVVAHRLAAKAVHTSGVLWRGTRGNVLQRNPMLAVMRDQAALVRVLAREFGLTPSARSDIRMEKADGSGAGAERYLS